MLKLIYSEHGLSIEHLPCGLSQWHEDRDPWPRSSGNGYPSGSHPGQLTTATLLIPRHAAAQLAQRPELEYWVADAHNLEVRLQGWWWADGPSAETGIFVSELDPDLEQWLGHYCHRDP
ncbi:MAG: hypothetical protein OHK0012_19850 [Synechococcales cyanobacterium]